MIRSAAATTEAVRESGEREGWGMDIAFRPEIDRKELRISLFEPCHYGFILEMPPKSL